MVNVILDNGHSLKLIRFVRFDYDGEKASLEKFTKIKAPMAEISVDCFFYAKQIFTLQLSSRASLHCRAQGELRTDLRGKMWT
jgi:hypothetical protein